MSQIMKEIDLLVKEKGINKDKLIDDIEKAVASACEKNFEKGAEFHIEMDRETGKIRVFAHKYVVLDVYNSNSEISLEEAKMIDPNYEFEDWVPVEITTKEFGRIAAQAAKSIIVQSIKEGERTAIIDYYKAKIGTIIVGLVQGYVRDTNNLSIRLDEKTDTVLTEKEMVPGEVYKEGDRIKLYVVDVIEPQKDQQPQPQQNNKRKERRKGFKVLVSRRRPELIKKLFEQEVSEISEGVVEIRSITREISQNPWDAEVPSSRTKIAVWSNDPNVDPVGSCVGLNSQRINNVLDELHSHFDACIEVYDGQSVSVEKNFEKIDVIAWSEDPSEFIKNALKPSDVETVTIDAERKSAKVIVPEDKLSLAIGQKGQNARLAARLTGFKIDIKSTRDKFSGEDNFDDDDSFEDIAIDED